MYILNGLYIGPDLEREIRKFQETRFLAGTEFWSEKERQELQRTVYEIYKRLEAIVEVIERKRSEPSYKLPAFYEALRNLKEIFETLYAEIHILRNSGGKNKHALSMLILDAKRALRGEPPLSHAREFIREEKPIRETTNKRVTRDTMKRFVEQPLVKACEIFYDKNIITISSSANYQNVGNVASIIIDYDLLSPENRRIAERCGKVSTERINTFTRVTGRIVTITVPVNENTTIAEVEARFVDIANSFKPQNKL